MSAPFEPQLMATALRRNASEFGDSPAIISGWSVVSWRQLDLTADAVAAGLASIGLVAGDRVVLLARTSARAITFLHAAARFGVVVVPLNERLATAELTALVAEAGARHVVADSEFFAKAASVAADVHSLEGLGAIASLEPRSPAAPSELAVMVTTSGTTGRPRLAALTHGQLSSSATSWNTFLPPASGWLTSLSLAHVGGLGIIWRAALAGVAVVVPDSVAGNSLGIALRVPEVSHASVVGVQMARLLDRETPPPNLEALLLGGGPVAADLVRRAVEAGWPVVPTYGMTESASGVTALAISEVAAHTGSAGRSLPGVELRIAGPGADGVGEIQVRSGSIFDGYFGRPEQTAEAFTSDGWYRTGDLGNLDDDEYLYVADRRLDLIVSGGENVYPAEVEAVLACHPAVADAGVVGRPDPKWGAVPVAAVVLRAGMVVDDRELHEHCRARLAGFKVPNRFVFLPEIPRSAGGKLNRGTLRQVVEAKLESPDTRLPVRYLVRPDGQRLGYRLVDSANTRRVVLLLHSTLSTGWQLKQLARGISGSAIVVMPDRRGSGSSRQAEPRPVDVEDHVADVIALMDELDVDRAAVFGHSYGGVLALALAAAHPERVEAVIAYEPPRFGDSETAGSRRANEIGGLVRAAHAQGGAAATAEVFLAAIGAADVLASASPSTRAAILSEGDGVLADVGAIETAVFDPAAIPCPVTLITGDAGESFYGPIANAAASAIPNATRVRLAGLAHNAPIMQPAAIAEVILAALTRD